VCLLAISRLSVSSASKSTDGWKELEKLVKALMPGDTVVVTKLDRLAGSSRDLQNILHDLKSRSCGLLSLGESWCDTIIRCRQVDADDYWRH